MNSKIGDNMRSGYKVTLGILTVMILVTITIGTSYSYYSIASEQTDPNEVTTTCFNIEYTEGVNGSINLPATYPMSESSALANLRPYEFTITNTCTSENASSPTNYVVTLNTLTANLPTLPLSLLRYKLNKTSPTTVTGTSTLLSNANVYELGATIKADEGIDTSYNLTTGTLAPGESVTYNLYLWIDETATIDIRNTTFTGRVLVYSYM